VSDQGPHPGQLASTDAEALGHLQAFADVGFWEYDLTTGALYLSTQVHELLQIDEPSVDAFLAVVHPDDIEQLRQVHRRARTQPGPYRVRHRTADGERVLQVRVQSVADASGTPVRYLGVIGDVTVEWRLEQALEQASAARVTGLLAGGAVHDLKNVFAVVLGHAELALAATQASGPDATSLQAIERAARRGLELTSGLLEVGRDAPVAARRVPVAGLFRRLELTAATVVGRHRSLVVDAGPGGHDLVVDESRLERVVVDLLLNARDALPAGAGSVAVTFRPLTDAEVDRMAARHHLPGGSYGAIEVVDDGSGIPADVLDRVTEARFTTKADSGGTGIGLHTVARFAEAAGGALEIASRPDAGTTVRIVLPTRAATEVPTRRRHAGRALVHGSDEERIERLCGAIRQAGIQVAVSTERAAALTVLQTEPIDVLVSDVPGPIDDVELLRVASATATSVLGLGDIVGTAPLDERSLAAVVDAVVGLAGRAGQRVRG